jgi:hypothetical protein
MSREPGSRTERLITGKMIEPTWALTDEQWARIGKAYSFAFEVAAVLTKTDESAKWRAEIETITRDLIREISIEQTAPAKADAVKYLHKIHYYSSELAKAIEGVKINPLARSMARGDLDGQLLLRDLGAALDDDAPPAMPIRIFAEHVRDVAQAADVAWREMQDEATTTPGDALERWIVRLSAFCEKNGFPVGVSDESDFVAFIMALISTLPAWAKPHARNAGAMARAIERAREAVKDRIRAQDNRIDEAEILMRKRARERHARRLDRANRRRRWRLGRSERRSTLRAAKQRVDI